MKKAARHASIILGLALLAAGFFLMKATSDPQGIMLALPYVCVGVGCGLFGHGMGDLVSERAVRGNPDIRKKIRIEKNDERNIAVADRAKGKAFDIMTFVFGALLLVFALMGIDMVAVLLLAFAYLFVHGSFICYRIRLEKEM